MGYSFPNASLSQANTQGSSHKPTTTYLIGLEYEILPRIAFEIDGIYATRGFQQTINTNTSEISLQGIQIPLLLRYYLAPTLSLGAGGYGARQWGSYQISTPSGLTQGSYGSTYDAGDYGVTLSLAGSIPLLLGIDFLIEGRYVYGLKNISHIPNESIYLRDYQLLFGLSLF